MNGHPDEQSQSNQPTMNLMYSIAHLLLASKSIPRYIRSLFEREIMISYSPQTASYLRAVKIKHKNGIEERRI